MFKMFEGEKPPLFWGGLITLTLAASALLGILCLISIEPPKTLPSLWNFWITPAPIKLGLLAAPIVGCVVLMLIGFYMMMYSIKVKESKAVVTGLLPGSQPAAVTKLPLEMAEVKGVGPTREKQLKALGINTIEDLAKASAKELAEKTKTSPETTSKWIEEAKRLMKWWKLLCSYIHENTKRGS